MHNAKSVWTAGCGLMVAAWLGACVESGKDPEHLNGSARNTCGPTDGPALEVVIRKTGAGGCADTGAIQARLFLNGRRTDSLAPGRSFTDSLTACPVADCTGPIKYRLQIESADGNSAHGSLEIREKDSENSETIKLIEVDLTKCPAVPQICG